MVMKKCCGVHAILIAVGIMMLGLLLAGGVDAATITVNASSSGDYWRIQDAINASSNGDTILVKSGTYFENVNVNKKLSLRGIGNPVVTAGGSGSAITLAANGITLEGFTATGSGYEPDAGIKVTSSNNTLTGNIASNNGGTGIFLSSSSNNTMSGNNGHISLSNSSNNTLIGNNGGIGLSSSNNNTLSGNNALNNYYGIFLSSSNDNMLSGNNASNNNYYGIHLYSSSKNVLINNIMKGNIQNFLVEGSSDLDFDNQIDTTNLVDGKHIYYLIKASDMMYDSSSNAGTFYCISCVNVTIKNLNLKGIYFRNISQSRIENVTASDGISLSSSSNNIMSGNNGHISLSNSSNNTLIGNNGGIGLSSSNNNTLSGNNALNNYYGIILSSSNNNTLIGNNASNNRCSGISLYSSSKNTLTGNNANSNTGDDDLDGYGIYLEESSNNMLTGNNAYNNRYGIVMFSSNDNMLTGNNATNNNYYGIFLSSSSKNVLIYNMMKGNNYNFKFEGRSDSDFDNQIDTTNLVDGKPVYYVKGAKDLVYDYSTNAGTFYCISCVNVTVKNLNLNNNVYGVFFRNTSHSRIQSVTASNNYYGISLFDSSNNTLSGNNASNNFYVDHDAHFGAGISVSYSSNNMLLGNNASNNGKGIILSSSSNNTLIGNNASNNFYGIGLSSSSNNTLIGNNGSNNGYSGIFLSSSNDNTLSGNNASNNLHGISLSSSGKSVLINNIMKGNIQNFLVEGSSDSDFDNQIDTTNLVDGKPVYYLKGAKDLVYDYSTNAGTFYCISCVNVTIKNLNLNNNVYGIFFRNTSQSRIQSATVSNNKYGISLWYSSNNTLTGNNANSNNGDDDLSGYGIYLEESRNNTLTSNNASNNGNGISLYSYNNNNMLKGNNASNNNYYGISLDHSSNNTLKGNNASNNGYSGIFLGSSSNNKIYNNIFNKNNNFYSSYSNNTWNTKKQPGTNIIGGPILGGNFWANPEGTGFSQTCEDLNKNGICEKRYILDTNNIDYLPLSMNFTKDTSPPKSVGNLKNITYAENYINWTWTDPKNIDFKKVMVFIDNKFKRNVSKGKMYYNATNFTANTRHTISTWTVDSNGNINKTWKNSSAWTSSVTV